MRRPSDDLPAADVPRTDRQPAAPARRVNDALEVICKVRSVRIHLHEKSRAIGEADPECVFIRLAEAELARPVQHADAGVDPGQSVGDLSSPVR